MFGWPPLKFFLDPPMLRGIKISQASGSQKAKAKQRLPITPEILRQIKARWKQVPPSQEKIMLWAAFLTCFFGFFQSGEICSEATGGKELAETPDLSVDRVEIDNIRDPSMIRLHLCRSKTDPFREGTTINLPRTGDDLCPVAALLSWLVYRGPSPGPLFRTQSGAPLTRPMQTRDRAEKGSEQAGARSVPVLRAQLSERIRHYSSSPRDPADSQIKLHAWSVEELSFSTLATYTPPRLTWPAWQPGSQREHQSTRQMGESIYNHAVQSIYSFIMIYHIRICMHSRKRHVYNNIYTLCAGTHI